MTVADIWASAWAQSLADQQARTDVHMSKWRVAGRKTKEKPEAENLAYWHEAGLEQVTTYEAWLKASGWKVAAHQGKPLVEFEVFHTFAAGTAPVKGFIDSVMRTPDGQLIIVDYKTGSRPPSGPQQLALYATMMRGLGMEAPTHGAYYMTRKGQLGPIEDLTRWDQRFWDRIFKQLNNARHMNLFLPNIGDHCGYCSVSSYCYAAGGTESAAFDPDDPNCNKPEF
jgi:RecB family exonuclease